MFFARFVRTNVVLAAFFLRMYVKKAAETVFVRKKRAKNVDEIDTRFNRHYKAQQIVILNLKYDCLT